MENLERRAVTCSVFVDLRKAFDTVNHSILLAKLDRYGVRGLSHDLLKSYLYHRKQYSIINGFKSDIKEISCGVPQGSTLGPLLFLIYVNDMYLQGRSQKVVKGGAKLQNGQARAERAKNF